MSDNIKPQDIIEMKRELKRKENEVSDFEFGFDIPSNKKKKQHHIPTRKNYRRPSVFIETDNVEPNNIQQTSSAQTDSIHKQSESVKNTCSFSGEKSAQAVHIFSPREQTEISSLETIDWNSRNKASTSANVLSQKNEENSLIIKLNPDHENDFTIIQHSMLEIEDSVTDSDSSSNEPLLFRNNYFKVLGEMNDSYRAMCSVCGFDENNKPKKIYSAKRNVSSNLITHLKVIFHFFFTLMFHVSHSFSTSFLQIVLFI